MLVFTVCISRSGKYTVELLPVEHSRIGSASSWWRALPFQSYYGVNSCILQVRRLRFGLKSVLLCGRAGQDHKNAFYKPLLKKDMRTKLLDDRCFQPDHEDCGVGHWNLKGCQRRSSVGIHAAELQTRRSCFLVQAAWAGYISFASQGLCWYIAPWIIALL